MRALFSEPVEQQRRVPTACNFLRTNLLRRRRLLTASWRESVLQSLRAAEIGNLQSIKRTLLPDQEIHIRIVKPNCSRQKGEPEFLALKIVPCFTDGVDRFAEFALGKNCVAHGRVNLSEASLRFPALWRLHTRISNHFLESLFGLSILFLACRNASRVDRGRCDSKLIEPRSLNRHRLFIVFLGFDQATCRKRDIG